MYYVKRRNKTIKTRLYILIIFFSSILFGNNITHAQTANLTNDQESLTIESGITLTVKGGVDNKTGSTLTNYGTISATGTWNNSGTFLDSGKVILNGSSAQNITGTSNFKELEINSSSTVTLFSGTQKVWHTLTLTDGTFDVSSDSLILLSNATRTARVGPVQSGASMTGSYTKQRYVTGSDGWRLLTSPMTGADIEGWNDDFAMTGFPGSDQPNSSWTSVWSYDETNTGTSDYGWTEATNTSNTLSPGKGFMCWVGENVGTDIAIIVDLTAGLTSGTQNITASYTDGSQDDTHDGWNLIGNPYPSDIYWNGNIGLSGTLTPFAYIYDPNTSNYIAFDTTDGRTIPSHQGFWVKVAGTGGTHNETITIEEQDKAGDGNNFLKMGQDSGLVVSVSGYGLKNKAILRFNDQATNLYDWRYDAFKLPSQNPDVPNLASVTGDGYDMLINTVPDNNNSFYVPMRIFWNDGEPSSIAFYQLTLTIEKLPAGIDLVCLEDLVTNEFIQVQEGETYPFSISYSINAPIRFALHGPGSNCQPSATTFRNRLEEQISIMQNSTDILIDFTLFTKRPVNIELFNLLGQRMISKSTAVEKGQVVLPKTGLSFGAYTVKVSTNNCVWFKKIVIH